MRFSELSRTYVIGFPAVNDELMTLFDCVLCINCYGIKLFNLLVASLVAIERAVLFRENVVSGITGEWD